MIAALFPAILIGGVLLLLRGLRGRAIDDHPICRRCGFDLIGKDAASTRCSECGSELTLAGAIRAGHRKRRWGLLISGIVLIVLCAPPAAMMIAVNLGARWQSYKPAWWLALEIGPADDAGRRDALV